MQGRVAQALVGSAGAGSLGRVEVEPHRCECVDHGAGGEKVFDGEAAGIRSRGDDGDDRAVAALLLQGENPLCDCRRAAGRARENRAIKVGDAVPGWQSIAPDKNVGALAHRGVSAPTESHLKTLLAAGVTHSSRVQTSRVRILLKLELDCTPDAAWRAIRTPAVLERVAWPFTAFTSLEADGFPELWTEGDHRVLVRAFGVADVGTQIIGVSFPPPRDGARILKDSGPPVSGPLAVITRWQHQLAVSALPDGRTLYRDQLKFSAGPATLLVWPALWAFWQWRAAGIRRLSATWDA